MTSIENIVVAAAVLAGGCCRAAEPEPWFTPPAEFAGDLGGLRSPLKFYDGRPVRSAAEWPERRREIIETWHKFLGPWPPLIRKPRVEYLNTQQRENFTQHRVRIEVAPGKRTVDGYLAVPTGAAPFPAVIVVYYDAETSIGLGKEQRDFAYQLTKRGFVSLSIGTPECRITPARGRWRYSPSRCWPTLPQTFIMR